MNEKKIKHLEFIQNVINRMAANSFKLKAWCMTIVAALITVANTAITKDSMENCRLLFWIGLVLVFIFGYMDCYYLKKERQYCLLYDEVRKKLEEEIDFSMNVSLYTGCEKGCCVWSSSIKYFYGSLICIFLYLIFGG